MDDPESYHKAEFLKSDMQTFFDEYKRKIRFRPDGKDSLLDIGCASGNITIDVIRSILPKTFSRLIGADICEKMVRYANDYFKLPNVSFEVLDIGGDITDFLETHERFDHITCTLCLHLVPDQQCALKNIVSLLQPNGDCLLYIIVHCFVFDTYVKMHEKWLKYMEDVDDYISPYYRRANPEYLLKKHLKNAGFTRYEVQLRTDTLVFDDVQKFKDNFRSVIPFLHRMTATEQDEFMDEFVKLSLQTKTSESCSDDGNKITVVYQLITAFAAKNQ